MTTSVNTEKEIRSRMSEARPPKSTVLSTLLYGAEIGLFQNRTYVELGPNKIEDYIIEQRPNGTRSRSRTTERETQGWSWGSFALQQHTSGDLWRRRPYAQREGTIM